MKNLPQRQTLVVALRNSFSGDLKAHHDATAFIEKATQHRGFANALMDILNDSSIEVGLKQTTLICLKNHIKPSWQSKRWKMSNWEKEDIKRAIIPAILQCDRRLIRAFKEILTLIAGFEYKSWLPIDQIIILINKEDNLVPLFHILIAIAKAFKFGDTVEKRHHFFEFIKASLPTVLNIVNKLQDQQLTYLGIKLLWKAVHYDISAEVKDLACEWMPLLQMVVSSTNSQFDRHPEQVQQRYSPEFYYFHSKKWANRIFLLFIQKHAKTTGYGRNNRIFSDLWYTTYGEQYISALLGMFSINTAKKVRNFQLKSLCALIAERPKYMEQYAQAFQQDILIRFIRMRPQDQQLASNQPLEFIQREKEPSINFFNTKLTAIDAWIAFSELGMQNKKQIYEPGVFFYQNISYLQSKLQSRDPVQKELAMCLLCQMHSHIIKSSQTKKILPLLINKYIVSQLRNPIMLLRARALDVFSDYGLIDLEEESMKEVFEAVYTCLTKDQHPLVRIKAAFAFNSIIKHKTAKHFVGPLIKDILTAYLQLLQNYDMDNIIDALQDIAQRFTAEISPFALDLIQSLAKIFFKSVRKDLKQSNKQVQDEEQAELIIEDCLKAITKIIESSVLPNMIQMEPTVLRIIEFICVQESDQFFEDGAALLSAYLYKCKEMSGELWLYCQVIVYSIEGIPMNMRSVIDELPLPENNRNILKHASSGKKLSIQSSLCVLRNYIQKISAMKDNPNMQAIKNNLVSLFFHLFNGTYKKDLNVYTDNERIQCTELMIYMLENFQSSLPDAFYNSIWGYFRLNLQSDSQSLNVINSQLLGLLLWAAPTQIIILARSQNMLAFLLNQITVYWPRYEQNYQRSRVILGINSLLLFANKSAEVQAQSTQLFKTVLSLIKKNANQRLQEQNQEQMEDQISQISEYYQDECFYSNYDSALNLIDEIAEFRRTIEQLGVENSIIYEQLIKSVPAEELTVIDDKIYRALQKAKNTYIDKQIEKPLIHQTILPEYLYNVS